MLVHILGNVIFSSARFWRSSLPVSGWNRKTEKARCRGERDWDEPGGGIRWPAGGGDKTVVTRTAGQRASDGAKGAMAERTG